MSPSPTSLEEAAALKPSMLYSLLPLISSTSHIFCNFSARFHHFPDRNHLQMVSTNHLQIISTS